MAAEVGNAVVSGVTSKVAELLFDPIQREISYVFKYKRFVEKLRSQLGDLNNIKQRLEQTVENARRQGDEIFDDVEQYLIQMNELIAQAGKLVYEEEDKAKNKRCFIGLCPNLMSRYKLSKEAVNAAKHADDLLKEGSFKLDRAVSYRPAPERTEITNVTRGYLQFDSRMKVFNNVMEALKDSNVDMIGVYGMGGVGKTTLAKLVEKKVVEDKLFEEVVMAEVTRNPDLKTIQDKFAYDLGLTSSQNESAFERVGRLRQRLKEKRVLVILDNIWEKLELEAIGIPFGNDEKEGKDVQRRCTVLLTSRSEHVLCNDMNSQKNFSIEVLSDAEAVFLFWKTVVDHSTETSFQRLADGIIKKCGGLPVAITTVASALKNKTLGVWNDALNRLCKSDARNIPGMDTNVYSAIKLSYDFLVNEEAKSLFRLCALQKDGSRIPIYDLMMYGMGLGCFTTVWSLEEVRHRLHALIDNLKSSCLLMDGDNEHVKMHDIIHDVGVWIAAEKHMFNLQNVADLENVIPKDPGAISITCRDIEELPQSLVCPKLNLLLIFANDRSSLQIQNLFSEEMKELRVLNLTQIVFPPSLLSLDCLINLRTLALIDCHSLVDVALVGDLKKLQVLSFRGSDIEQLPSEIGELAQLKLLDLSNCSRLKVIAPNVISKLSRLEELYMVNSFTRWEKGQGGSNASLVELKALLHLTTLEINIRDVKIVPQDLVSVELERFKIFLGEEWMWMWMGADNKAEILRTMKICGLVKNRYLGKGMKMLLKRTEELYLGELNDCHNVVNELDDGEGFPQLKHLFLKNSPGISCVVNLVRQGGGNAFPLLESLILCKLINLEEICHGQLTEDQSFSKLRIIKVERCHELKHLFSLSVAKNLSQLQEITVTDCKSLKLFVGEERENYMVCETEDINNKVTFPALETLILSELNMEKIWFDQLSIVENLKDLQVKGFDHLKFLFSYSMVRSLVRLQNLVITECKSMEWIINTNGLSRDEEQMIGVMAFPKLKSLTLSLPGLERFVSMSSMEENKIIHSDTNVQSLFDGKVTFPSLETLILSELNMERIWFDQVSTGENLTKLEVINCGHLKFLFSYSILPSFVQLQNLVIERCFSMECVINTNELRRDEEQMIGVMVFPKLKSLALRVLPRLTRFVSMSLSENNIIYSDTNRQSLFDEKVTFSALETLILFKLNMERIWLDQVSTGKNLIKLKVEDCGHLKFLFSYSILSSFAQLQNLAVNECKSMECVINTDGLRRDEEQMIGVMAFPKLKKLVLSLPRLKRFVSLSSSEENSIIHNDTNPQYLFDDKVGFPSLETLRITNMRNFTKIWHHQLDSDSFRKLKQLEVVNFGKLMNIFSLNIILERRFHKLEEMSVMRCDLIKEIIEEETSSNLIVDEEVPIARTSVDATRRFEVFPQLTSMELWYLPYLESIYQGEHILEWPALKKLKVYKCKKVEILFGSSELFSQGTESQPPVFLIDHQKVAFPNLKTLRVSSCKRLRYLVTLSTVEILIKLARIEIHSCKMIEEIVQQVGEVKVDPIVFSQLVDLKLNNLPRLEHFFGADYTLEFPYLYEMVVSGCLNMKIFSHGVLHTPKLQNVKLTNTYQQETEDRWDGSLNSTIQKMFEEMAGFYGLNKLVLSQDPLVKEIWYGQTSPVSFFSNLHTLVVDDCKLMSSAIPASHLRCSKNLETLTIKNCDSVEEVFHMEELNTDEHSVQVFPELWHLYLIDLPNLKRFCNCSWNTIELRYLWNLSIQNCPNIETFISNATHAPSLFNEKVAFRLSGTLKLSKLPKLLYLCKENSSPIDVFQELRTLEISECSKLEQVVPSWVSFQNLIKMEVSKCDGLINLMTLSTAKSLMQLGRMKITNCKMIEEIIHVGEELKNDCIVFNQLEYLELSCLPNLTNFCLGNYTLEFPSLEQVIVRECPKMEIFSRGVLSTPRLERLLLTEIDEKEIVKEEWLWEGSLNSTIQKLFEEMNLQSSKDGD